jgi:hypothetical protein
MAPAPAPGGEGARQARDEGETAPPTMPKPSSQQQPRQEVASDFTNEQERAPRASNGPRLGVVPLLVLVTALMAGAGWSSALPGREMGTDSEAFQRAFAPFTAAHVRRPPREKRGQARCEDSASQTPFLFVPGREMGADSEVFRRAFAQFTAADVRRPPARNGVSHAAQTSRARSLDSRGWGARDEDGRPAMAVADLPRTPCRGGKDWRRRWDGVH